LDLDCGCNDHWRTTNWKRGRLAHGWLQNYPADKKRVRDILRGFGLDESVAK
jgi:hypothetical protein